MSLLIEDSIDKNSYTYTMSYKYKYKYYYILLMEAPEQIPYKITKEDGSSGPSSTGYTGKADVEYPNKDTYSGDFINGLKEGKGVYTFNNGDKYSGEWKANLQHGIGRTEYFKNEKVVSKYQGRYANGKRNGEGVFTYENGDIYSGTWVDGEKNGKGTYIVNACKLEGNHYMKVVGDWVNGEITKGRWIFPDKTYYEGEFEENLPKNKGKWLFSNGNELNGEYFHSEAIDKETNEILKKLSWRSDEVLFDPRIHLISG